jgi:hypothetical protein
MYTKVDLKKPGPDKGVGGGIKNEVIIFDFDEISETNGIPDFPQRDDGGVKMLAGNIGFKPGCYAVKVYGTAGTFENTSESAGETDGKGWKPGCKFSYPGNELEGREFAANWLNMNIGVAQRRCDDPSKYDIYGTPCCPLELNSKWTHNKEKNTSEFTFNATGIGKPVGIYLGTFTFDEGSGS